MTTLIRAFLWWLPLGIAITGMCLLVNLTVQQNYRQSLNDPQVQMAEDGATALASGAAPASLVVRGVPLTDIAVSLAPWIVVYDSSGIPLESSAVLDGKPPQLPQGVLDAAKNGLPLIVGHHLTADIPANENRVSWQPNPSVRQAVVVDYVPQTGQFVVAGRNMREVENREGDLSMTVWLAWLCMMAATLIAAIFAEYLRRTF